MPVDPRMFAPADIVGAYHRGAQMRQQREEMQGRRRLGDLLPGAANGDQEAMNEIARIDPRLFMQLDERQKAQAAAELDDVVGAVRWADTPEKWAQVQQYYGSHGHDVSGYTFENRESYLLSLGKMGEYLKGAGGEPTSMQRNYEFLKGQNPELAEQYLRGQAEGSPIVQRNEDGTMTVYPRSVLGGAGQAQSGPRVGTVEDGYRFKGGDPADPKNWHKIGGQTPQASGPFPPAGY